MLNTKNRRYGPLYKKFIRLRKNVQYRNKLLKNKITFNKQKWKNLIIFLKRRSQIRKGKGQFNLYDHTKSYIPRFGSSFKRKFKENLMLKQKFSLFYGHLPEKLLKRNVILALNKVKTYKTVIDPTFFFLEALETRLDSVLYRAHFVLSLKAAHQIISHGNVKVNGSIVCEKSFKLKQGDLLEIVTKVQKRVYWNIAYGPLWPMPPKHLQINYKTLQIVYVEDIKSVNFATLFPFKIDLKSIIRLFNY